MFKKARSRRPGDHIAAKLRGKDFVYPDHVRVTGDIKLKGVLVVGGNLTVQGDLEAKAVYCFGSLVVGGNVKNVGDCYVGQSIEVGGDLQILHIENAYSVEAMIDLLRSESFAPEFDQDDEDGDAISLWLAPDMRDELETEAEMTHWGLHVRVGTNFTCFGLNLKGHVSVGGQFDVDAGEISDGSVTANELIVEDELQVHGDLICNTLLVSGELSAGQLTCHGNANGGDLSTEDDVRVLGTLEGGDITSGGSIQAGRWIAAYGAIDAREYVKAGESVVSETAIRTGRDYGILAGLCVARSEWPTRGFVSAPTRPKNIISGKFVPGKVYDDMELQDGETDDKG